MQNFCTSLSPKEFPVAVVDAIRAECERMKMDHSLNIDCVRRRMSGRWEDIEAALEYCGFSLRVAKEIGKVAREHDCFRF